MSSSPDTSAAVDAERRLRALVARLADAGLRRGAAPRVVSLLAGPAGSRLQEIEDAARRRFFLRPTGDGHGLDHFAVVAEGKLDDLRPAAPFAEGDELELKLVEVGLHDSAAGVGKVDAYDVCVADAAKQVGKKVRVRIERVVDGIAYASWVDAPGERTSAARRSPWSARRAASAAALPEARSGRCAGDAGGSGPCEPEAGAAETEAEGGEPMDAVASEEETTPKKRTRRGTRGGRRRKKPATAGEAAQAEPEGEPNAPPADEPLSRRPPRKAGRRPRTTARGGRPASTFRATRSGVMPAPEAKPADAGERAEGADEPEPLEVAAEEDETAETKPPARKKTRRGTRGGRGRKRKGAARRRTTVASRPPRTRRSRPPTKHWSLQSQRSRRPKPRPTRRRKATRRPRATGATSRCPSGTTSSRAEVSAARGGARAARSRQRRRGWRPTRW